MRQLQPSVSHLENQLPHEDGDLIVLFYIPALECDLRYDRMTGYFSADALALAGRGIERLIANDGAMRLIVGCTLDEAEVQAIEQGYDLRAIVEKNLIEAKHAADEVEAFERLWSDQAKSVKIIKFPEAARKKVLEFLPKDAEVLWHKTHGGVGEGNVRLAARNGTRSRWSSAPAT